MLRELVTRLVCLCLVASSAWTKKCGYDSCPDTESLLETRPDTIFVHLIPHTHDDVGWLKTLDQYYYGTNIWTQRANVRLILDSVIAALALNSERKFTYVEMEFFTKWWALQPNSTRTLVHQLVENGQLHFVLAGICMSDEATVHYEDSINQLTWGVNFLKDTFGECGKPRVAWQIDPFGHSRDQMRIFRDAGFDGVYFQRMDYREKQHRRDQQKLEHLWLVDPDANVNASNPRDLNSKAFFTGVLYDTYCYPATFCFDTLCQDEQLVDDPESTDYNAGQRVALFLRYLKRLAPSFRTSNMIIPMGCDFTYENALQNFLNTDILMRRANELYESGQSQFKLIYSTPDCYTLALNKAFNKLGEIPMKAGDFFPYASENDRYWTGFYTSRPAFKNFVRKSSNELKMCEQIHLRDSSALISRLASMPHHASAAREQLRTRLVNQTHTVDMLRRVMGISLHHDALTGTAKQHVANDYSFMLDKAVQGCRDYVSRVFQKNIQGLTSQPQFCSGLNISLCEPLIFDSSITRTIHIMIYNTLGWALPNTWVKVPVYLESLELAKRIILINNATGMTLSWQLLPLPDSTIRIPERQSAKENFHLFFNTMSSVPAMGLLTVTLSYSSQNTGVLQSLNFDVGIKNQEDNIVAWAINNPKMSLTPLSLSRRKIALVDDEAGESKRTSVMSFTFLEDPLRTIYDFHVELLVYKGNSKYGNSSGAYIFQPMAEATPPSSDEPKITTRFGALVQEKYIKLTPWADLTVRVYRDQQLEVDWVAGPIPDNMGMDSKELIVRYWFEQRQKADNYVKQPDEHKVNKHEFHVDSNGRRMIRRVNGRRIYWNVNVTMDSELDEPRITGNYYPVVTRAMIRNQFQEGRNQLGFAVYTDRAQGMASLHEGKLEFMVNRRTVSDDGFGVSESLRENGIDGKALVVKGTHLIKLDFQDALSDEDQQIATEFSNPVLLYFANKNDTRENFSKLDQIRLLRVRRRVLTRRRRAIEFNIGSYSNNLLNVLNPLPSWVNLMTVSKWPLNDLTRNGHEALSLQKEQLLLRFEVFNTSITPDCTQIDLTSLFTDVIITNSQETAILGNVDVDEMTRNRLKWPQELQEKTELERECSSSAMHNSKTVSLRKGEIHTFVCDFEKVQA